MTMGTELEYEFLLWINEYTQTLNPGGDTAKPVPIKILMIRLSTLHRDNEELLTKSVELSLSTFDRATLFRILRQLGRKEMIEFVDAGGKRLSPKEEKQYYEHDASDRLLGYVKLTDRGVAELKRLKICREKGENPDIEPEGNQ